MNHQKIAFIICYNNELYLTECLKYISFLNIPMGIEVETITILEAPGIAAGYNAAMNSSDAKYKVYLHQDVFILYSNFINDVLEIFDKNPDYGMIGVIGADNVPVNANFWCCWNKGCTYANNSVFQCDLKYSNDKSVIPVSAIDGMIMITQYDIRWREDVFDGFDFYDASQSIEFYKAGYQVGIPYQKEVWCVHDCGHSKLNNYDRYRKKFCEEYAQYGFTYSEITQQTKRVEMNAKVKEDIQLVSGYIEEHEIDKALKAVTYALKTSSTDTQLSVLNNLCQILSKEDDQNIRNGFFCNITKIEDLIDRYYRYRFFLMRIYYQKSMEDLLDVCMELAAQDRKGLCALEVIAECITLTKEQADELIKKYIYLVS